MRDTTIATHSNLHGLRDSAGSAGVCEVNARGRLLLEAVWWGIPVVSETTELSNYRSSFTASDLLDLLASYAPSVPATPLVLFYILSAHVFRSAILASLPHFPFFPLLVPLPPSAHLQRLFRLYILFRVSLLALMAPFAPFAPPAPLASLAPFALGAPRPSYLFFFHRLDSHISLFPCVPRAL